MKIVSFELSLKSGCCFSDGSDCLLVIAGNHCSNANLGVEMKKDIFRP